MSKKILIAIAVLAALLILAFPRGAPQVPTTPLDPGALIATISRGEEVQLEDHLDPQAWTVVEFTADW